MPTRLLDANHRSGVILAGGASRRMGQAKAALPFGNGTILARLITELLTACAELIVVAGPPAAGADSLAAVLTDWTGRVTVLRDQAAFAGPVPALVRGLRAARHATVFVCACDLPLLRAPVAAQICARLDGFDAAIPVIGGQRQPLCAAYRAAAADQLEAHARAGDGRLTTIVARLDVRWLAETELRLIDPELNSFLNVNTPADYARALRLAGFTPAPGH